MRASGRRIVCVVDLSDSMLAPLRGAERGDVVAADVRRMNLFRNAEIHVVAIGEADAQLLRAIAAVGHGQVRFVGQPAPAAAAPR